MISFGQFSDILDNEKEINECAKLISIFDYEPSQIIESVLEDDILESWKSWLGGMGRAAKAAGQIAGGVASGVAAGGQRAFQGVKQAGDTMGGPLTKFQNAVDTLKDLEKMLRNNPATKQVASKSAPKRSIAGYIQMIHQALEKERLSMPQMAGSNKIGSETPDKYLRGSQIQKRQAARQANSANQSGKAASKPPITPGFTPPGWDKPYNPNVSWDDSPEGVAYAASQGKTQDQNSMRIAQ